MSPEHPLGLLPAPAPQQLAVERQQARLDAALRAGWVIRFDPDRLEYRAARELLTERTLDALLDVIEGTP